MRRWIACAQIGLAGASILAGGMLAAADPPPVVECELVLDTLRKGYDGSFQFVHPRAGIVPRGENRTPEIVLTMSRQFMFGSDVYFELNQMRTVNLGRTWTGPIPQSAVLGRRDEPDGVVVVVSDFTPQWHARSGKLLGTGHTVRYVRGKDEREAYDMSKTRQTAYSVYDPEKSTWAPWVPLAMPADDRFHNAGAGSTQRVDLPNGDILLPIYTKPKGSPDFTALVIRCSFDGKTLQVKEIGNELKRTGGRGYPEPSLVYFRLLR